MKPFKTAKYCLCICVLFTIDIQNVPSEDWSFTEYSTVIRLNVTFCLSSLCYIFVQAKTAGRYPGSGQAIP